MDGCAHDHFIIVPEMPEINDAGGERQRVGGLRMGSFVIRSCSASTASVDV
jgi:hypothetical protein